MTTQELIMHIFNLIYEHWIITIILVGCCFPKISISIPLPKSRKSNDQQNESKK